MGVVFLWKRKPALIPETETASIWRFLFQVLPPETGQRRLPLSAYVSYQGERKGEGGGGCTAPELRWAAPSGSFQGAMQVGIFTSLASLRTGSKNWPKRARLSTASVPAPVPATMRTPAAADASLALPGAEMREKGVEEVRREMGRAPARARAGWRCAGESKNAEVHPSRVARRMARTLITIRDPWNKTGCGPDQPLLQAVQAPFLAYF